MTTMQRDRYPYGSVTEAIREWVHKLPVGKEFYYAEAAEELDIQLPTVSSVMLKIVRGTNPPIVHGNKTAWYRRVDNSPARLADSGRREAPERKLPVQEPAKPAGPKADDVMVVVGTRKTGAVLLRDEDGNLWEASAI